MFVLIQKRFETFLKCLFTSKNIFRHVGLHPKSFETFDMFVYIQKRFEIFET